MTALTRDYAKELQDLFPGKTIECSDPRRYWMTVGLSELESTVVTLREKLDLPHLATIVGEDMRDHFLVSYFMAGEVVVTVRVRVDREKPEVPSLAKILAGALVYERELLDILGIMPVGHPDLRRQAVPEDWPEGLYPLRKDVTFPRAKLDDGGEGKS